ncbi:4-diphosphocytidyl-2-C-methyl-D-erythritol kinase [Rubripirellula tenax]|uniref:4-diphosphocytidyl-2-C-methyl-D-erythritol kinase n=1 Tax=Rubripirellula tenax TaxID=2528015 RepID=A0A5C6EJC1_9BACT|nr:4-(cytidine 5'-diphospho)-2-C-methyl-D-erythritol kinase [Rubripirellula tenax]TWU48594.1 4-diphosphocytidyl-2-C-methyl-D-erythritol kinase [Rubripirellula tenax]
MNGLASKNAPEIGGYPVGTVAHTRAPAKLNLFLELKARRDDGFHEIDTVMVPIDWCDELRIRRSTEPGIRLTIDWLPSRKVVAQRLGIDDDPKRSNDLLSIPVGESNLVSRALSRFIAEFNIVGGFDCELRKSVPAGAGMGGASSDAASAIACAAKLCGIDSRHPKLMDIAASIGSDVPFFLGLGINPMSAIRATGRGECLSPVNLAEPLHVVVIYPSVSLSTGKVYAASQVPDEPIDGSEIVRSLERGDLRAITRRMINRLSEPARILAPQIDEIIESVWRTSGITCQLTGSGSACFAIVRSPVQARRLANLLQATLGRTSSAGSGAVIVGTRTTQVPTTISIQ